MFFSFFNYVLFLSLLWYNRFNIFLVNGLLGLRKRVMINMNGLQYKIMNSMYQKSGKVELDLERLNDEFFEYLDKFSKYFTGPNFSKDEFLIVIMGVYNVLKLKIDDDMFLERLDTYVRLLLADVIDRHYVDVKWCVDKLFYFVLAKGNSLEVNKVTGKIKNDILYIQNMLYKEFSIKEYPYDRFSRKIYTRYMTNLG